MPIVVSPPQSTGAIYWPTTANNTGMWYTGGGTATATVYTTTPSTVGTIYYPSQIVTTASTTTTQFISIGAGTSLATSAWIYYPDSPTEWKPTPEQLASEARYRREQQRLHAIKVERAKGSIKRALKLMDNVGFGNEVSVFLGGSAVEVSHPDSMFKFLLSKSRHVGIIDKTINISGHMIPYKLELYTKTDVHVADLCVYMQDTPILDQILALSMFIKSGDEDYILEKANWTIKDRDPVLRQAILLEKPSLVSKLKRIPYNHRH